jgi:hypothetical protein
MKIRWVMSPRPEPSEELLVLRLPQWYGKEVPLCPQFACCQLQSVLSTRPLSSRTTRLVFFFREKVAVLLRAQDMRSVRSLLPRGLCHLCKRLGKSECSGKFPPCTICFSLWLFLASCLAWCGDRSLAVLRSFL